ncbi:NADH:flavin oxidoreductase/NADH oxidase family protein [Flexibacterium corallicola]|uniref:NADH:flavin oxidoreductase/NADH oxidase family protein n=1 Tax=Flexibacterium corallicola TaxID=3037259 RepID=UPI00286F9027|nr:NADH:flavin oxidoreductase/NADH oxidase family protein [Pseudovibrio sp. M1P-2-3]
MTVGTPYNLSNGTTLKNRFFKAAMSEQLADRAHNPTSEITNLYRAWAKGGAALVVTGNIMVDRRQLGEPKNVVLDSHSDLKKFKEWAKAGAGNNTQVWVQLNHPGKQVPNFINSKPVAPSAIPFKGALRANFAPPRALQETEIYEVIDQFAKSAQLAKNAGFQGIQIHAAHGYLINQFLSPRHNRREDQWGGSIENRMRFLLEVYEEIRKVVGPQFPVGVKLNSADFSSGGFSEEDSLFVIKHFGEVGVDLIEVSGGSYENTAMADGVEQKDSTIKREAYFLEFAEKARKHTDTCLVVTGGFRSVQGMNEALTSNATDLIGMARPMSIDPDLPNKALSDSNYKISLRKLTTGIRTLDKMVLLNMTWYEAQLARIGQGKPPSPALSEWRSTLMVLSNLGLYAFKKRRA